MQLDPFSDLWDVKGKKDFRKWFLGQKRQYLNSRKPRNILAGVSSVKITGNLDISDTILHREWARIQTICYYLLQQNL